ncbi:MAG TPA: glycoside hydrolase family 3 C-terminal domain-containing protein [Candidatus Protoclostridium stercorigallinarum]|uniref:Glycoside hydrolase family 3 C-terminal domain-containing protein n=1 Tax=Candidatus Protoclostridium stercorigallinarum TaxID=2838741 RepID=A0A9D1TRF5_9FIRM|nr:glycoside hydrolase family 3 C-terminal domain-containing protein [Candidatus Protoclostridium stercorigallinarum]
MNKFFRIFAKTANIWRGLLTAFVALLLVAFFLTQFAFANKIAINSYLGLVSSKAVQTGNAEVASHYKSEFAADVKNPTQEEFDALKAASKEQAINEMKEGAVLLRNNDVNGAPALPLAKGASISLFGHASEDPLYKPPSGGAQYSGNPQTNVKDGLARAGFKINDTLYNAYANARSSGTYGSGTRSEVMTVGDWNLYEAEPAFYEQSGLRDSYKNYGDAAVIFLARTAGENRDCPTGNVERDAIWYQREDPTQDYLALFPEEEALLSEVKAYKDNGTFKKVILVLNTSNLVQMPWLDEYGIDACLYTAGYGHHGTIALGSILCGETNPSGRLVDTWAYDFQSSPAMTNFGAFTYTNADQMLTAENRITENPEKVEHYVVYAEGIYIGYKYYETRYEDAVLGNGDADSDVGSSTEDSWKYSDEVQYPFGYGLSYTDFSLEIVEEECSYDPEKKGEEFTIAVKVTNTGDVAGKRSVQLYVQAPYIEYGVEKSSVQLVGFGKTGVLAPAGQEGDSETITITVDKYLLASYDYEGLNDNGVTGYILDAGDYRFAVGDSVHDALNYILADKGATGMTNHDGSDFAPDATNHVWKWNLAELDTETYHYSQWNENEQVEVTNRLEEMDLNYWLPDTVTYLTRSDWSGTYPTEHTVITLTQEMAIEISGNYYGYDNGDRYQEFARPEDAPAVSDFTQGAKNGITFSDMHGIPYEDDETWNKFIDQLTVEDMLNVIWEHWGTYAISSVGKPWNWNDDGPDGINQGFKIQDEDGNRLPHISGECTMFPNEIVLAQTYSYDLLTRRGEMLGEESMFSTCVQLWSPGGDLHRTPYGGRNFEYYSEDSYMSYLCAGAEVAAMRSKGVVTAIKHCCGNNQETYRQGLSTFSNEQSFRMNDMRGFEGAFTIGKSNSTMTSFNRVGMRAYCHSKVMQQDVMRGEWGFKGVIISDAIDSYMHPVEAIIAGNDQWCLARSQDSVRTVKDAINGGDGYILQMLRQANKNFYYAYCNSNLVNGMSSDMVIIPVTNWWETALTTANTVLLVITIVAGVLFISSAVVKAIVSRKDKANSAEEA